MANAPPVPSGKYPDHVEAEGVEAWFALGEVLDGERAQGGLFTRRYGFEWVAVGGSPAQFHLDENKGAFFA